MYLCICVLVSQAKARLSIPIPGWTEQPGLPNIKAAFFPHSCSSSQRTSPALAHLSPASGPQISRTHLRTHLRTKCYHPPLLHGVLRAQSQHGGFSAPIGGGSSSIRSWRLQMALGLLLMGLLLTGCSTLSSVFSCHSSDPTGFTPLACWENGFCLIHLVAG